MPWLCQVVWLMARMYSGVTGLVSQGIPRAFPKTRQIKPWRLSIYSVPLNGRCNLLKDEDDFLPPAQTNRIPRVLFIFLVYRSHPHFQCIFWISECLKWCCKRNYLCISHYHFICLGIWMQQLQLVPFYPFFVKTTALSLYVL